MFLLLIDGLLARWPGLGNLHGLDKITLRASLAAVASFVLALLLGPRLIAWLQARFREPIKSASAEVAQLHQAKQSTPTMGGIFIVAGLIASTFAFGDWSNSYLPIAILVASSLGALGAYDDLVKLTTSARGVSARTKLIAQLAIALTAAVLVYRGHDHLDRGLELAVPLGGGSISLGWCFIPFATLVIVASSNAVNLADGLDGLAGGCLVCATGAVALLAYASGHAQWAHYLNIPHIAGAGEMVVVAAAMVGGLLGFLWFNCHPASVFMGDTGSLPLGGLLGLLAVIARQELLLLVIGGVFVVEAASVIAQVGWYRWNKKRIFLCAPLHHHFQLRGWPEGKIVVRFWIAAALCAIVGLAGLKLRPKELVDFPQLTGLQQLKR
ncbi:MAG: phospho-N-acetylmuramoyl-pentapeptide-transferase [Planctomycetia bacterium]|nr:phospho-N-acetylmuramoyl-pentapeptide-transferase [Planctomycetia bacterium]